MGRTGNSGGWAGCPAGMLAGLQKYSGGKLIENGANGIVRLHDEIALFAGRNLANGVKRLYDKKFAIY